MPQGVAGGPNTAARSASPGTRPRTTRHPGIHGVGGCGLLTWLSEDMTRDEPIGVFTGALTAGCPQSPAQLHSRGGCGGPHLPQAPHQMPVSPRYPHRPNHDDGQIRSVYRACRRTRTVERGWRWVQPPQPVHPAQHMTVESNTGACGQRRRGRCELWVFKR